MCLSRLGLYRTAADYSAARAFDETVSAVEGLSLSLKKIGFVSDHVLGRSICSNAYAQAMSAQASLSVLPFSTQELEKLSAFLNIAGDYSASLLAQDENQLSAEQRGYVEQLAAAAADFSARLTQLQSEVNDGSLLMDSLEQNFGYEDKGENLSARLLSYEQEFQSPEDFAYDGKYSPAEENSVGSMGEEEAKSLAAQAAGVEPRELKEEYSYEGPEGRRCYSAGDLKLCVSANGLESMSQSRLVSGGGLSGEEARGKAESFLESMGYSGLGLDRENLGDTLAVYRYAPEQDGALRRDDYISISVALDDGSIYAFDASRYKENAPELLWNIDEEAARSRVPSGVMVESARKVIIKSPGGNYLPCFELQCVNDAGEMGLVYVDAESGKQCKIEMI